jgi:hypothetical protein
MFSLSLAFVFFAGSLVRAQQITGTFPATPLASKHFASPTDLVSPAPLPPLPRLSPPALPSRPRHRPHPRPADRLQPMQLVHRGPRLPLPKRICERYRRCVFSVATLRDGAPTPLFYRRLLPLVLSKTQRNHRRHRGRDRRLLLKARPRHPSYSCWRPHRRSVHDHSRLPPGRWFH